MWSVTGTMQSCSTWSTSSRPTATLPTTSRRIARSASTHCGLQAVMLPSPSFIVDARRPAQPLHCKLAGLAPTVRLRGMATLHWHARATPHRMCGLVIWGATWTSPLCTPLSRRMRMATRCRNSVTILGWCAAWLAAPRMCTGCGSTTQIHVLIDTASAAFALAIGPADLRCKFGVLQPTYDCARRPADVAASAAQAAFRRFLVQARTARQQQHMAALHPGCRYASRTLYDRATTTRATADQAALELQRAEAKPHDADAPVAHTAARCASLRTAAAAAGSISQLASAAEACLEAVLLAAQRLRVHTHGRLARRVLVTWHMHAAMQLARQARAARSIRHARSRLLQAAFCTWQAEHTAARTP